MILFSTSKLEKTLANDSLDSWEKAKYVIFVVAVYGMSNSLYWFTPSFGPEKPLSYHAISFVSWLLGIVIIYFGVRKCYRRNKTGDGKAFVERLVALYVPLTFEFIPITLFCFAVLASVITYALPIGKETKYLVFPYATLPLTLFLTWLFFVLLDRSFERLAELVRAEKGHS